MERERERERESLGERGRERKRERERDVIFFHFCLLFCSTSSCLSPLISQTVQISSVVRDLVREERTVEVLRQLVGDNVKCMQTMMFMKGAGKPGQATHQDEFYIQTRDRSDMSKGQGVVY